ncbi:hypothetical protein [Rhodopseudomonas sp. BR0M22]|uniref:hypothetical protein n=1 Tax=Rhodopseudomonas sp. BR0M22 TaxID=2269369 RepID=UPI001967D647|nr:hypothetical protein [Rhodopseudomonas sp. BR0M22]
MRFASRLAMNGMPSLRAFTWTEERARFKAAAARTADAPLAISSFNRSTCSSSHGLQALLFTDIGIGCSSCAQAPAVIDGSVGGLLANLRFQVRKRTIVGCRCSRRMSPRGSGNQLAGGSQSLRRNAGRSHFLPNSDRA